MEISIHTPREGSDLHRSSVCGLLFYFNPHSPRGERRLGGVMVDRKSKFQSTLPARGATRLGGNTTRS